MATETKKRPSFAKRSIFDLPKWAQDDKKFVYRWVSSTRLDRTDGYDPRGWVYAKIPAGEDKAGELMRLKGHILCRMPIEESEARKHDIKEQTEHQMSAIAGAQQEMADRATHEFKQAGGKLKLNVNIE
jgi:hypothetical protein